MRMQLGRVQRVDAAQNSDRVQVQTQMSIRVDAARNEHERWMQLKTSGG